ARATSLEIGVGDAVRAKELAAAELSERADRLGEEPDAELPLLDVLQRVDAELLLDDGDEIVRVQAADEAAQVFELRVVRFLALERPAVRHRERERQRRLVPGHQLRVPEATGEGLHVDVRARRQGPAQQLGHRRTVDVPRAARVERGEGQRHRGLGRNRAHDEENEESERDDPRHHGAYTSVRRAPRVFDSSRRPPRAPGVDSVAAKGEAPRVASQDLSGLPEAAGATKSRVGGPMTKRWPTPRSSSLTMRWPGLPSTFVYQPATRPTSSTATVTVPMPVTPLAWRVCRGTRCSRGVSSWIRNGATPR